MPSRLPTYTTFASVGFVMVLMVLTPGRAFVDRTFFQDEPSLEEGLDSTVALASETSEVADNATDHDLDFEPDHRLQRVESADPDQAGDLSNNYSIFDHSNKARFPGFDDCDSWKNVVDDGWSAHYSVTAGSTDLSDGERRTVLDEVRSYWKSQGFVVVYPSGERESDATGLRGETDHGRISFGFNERRGTVSVTGTTDCLPPS